MFKLANDPKRNVAMIPENYWEQCRKVVEQIFEEDLTHLYTRQQLLWMLECYEWTLDQANPEWWDIADAELDGSESPVWDAVTMRESADAFRAQVRADWLCGVALSFQEYPNYALKSLEHLQPKVESYTCADTLLDMLKARL